jgi:hypothetical protein
MPAEPRDTPGTPDRLPPLERTPTNGPRVTAALAPTVSGDRAAARERASDAPTPARGTTVEVRYGLDPVASVWVAQLFDGESGEFVKSVPATHVNHQLAALRVQHDGVDMGV